MKVVIYFLNAYQTQENKLEEIKVRKKKSLTLTKRGKKEAAAQKYMVGKSHLCPGESAKKKGPRSAASSLLEINPFSLRVAILNDRFYQRGFYLPICSDFQLYFKRIRKE